MVSYKALNTSLVVKKKKWICHIQQKLDKKLLILLL